MMTNHAEQGRLSAGRETLVKVAVILDPEDNWHGYTVETLWAEPVGAHRYRLVNSPFYAKGLSFEDVIVAERIEDQLTLTGVAERGGHSTYQIRVAHNVLREQFLSYWQFLEALGCTHEEASSDQLFTIDVPPTADIHVVYSLLTHGEQAGVWSFQEGHCGHAFDERC